MITLTHMDTISLNASLRVCLQVLNVDSRRVTLQDRIVIKALKY